ncbi:MAG: hypothetical protein HY064_07150 [Bacteroidetes bacterium]|nr:hypothetical protein [Bacteroidota bacterium]
MKIIIKISALRDIQEIFEWYEKEAEGLGEKFLEDFQKTLSYLVMYSRSFRISGQSIIIQRVGHQSRNKRKLKL